MLELLALGPLAEEQKETLEIARDSGRALGRIIDDILDHAQIGAGKMRISVEPMSIDKVLQRVVNSYSAQVSAKGLGLSRAVDPRLSPTHLGDPLRLMQVLGNFVSNAIKFTASGSIDVRAVVIGSENRAETLLLSVKDTGSGLTHEAQSRIFKPFEQANTDTSRWYGGTGLGLAICSRLVDMMGGSIEIESAPGVGTTMSVRLTLPIDDSSPAAGVALLASVTSPDSKGVELAPPGPLVRPLALAVEDDPTSRLLLVRQLEILGLRAETAGNGEEALALWRARAFALVITDGNMPVLDGYELTRAIREIEAEGGRSRTPVIALTGNAMEGAMEKCRTAGMDDMLTKPTDLAQLKAVVSKWLGRALVVGD